MRTEYANAYNVAARLLREDIFPTPTLMSEELCGYKSNNLNGEKTKARAAALKSFGYKKNSKTGRWERP